MRLYKIIGLVILLMLFTSVSCLADFDPLKNNNNYKKISPRPGFISAIVSYLDVNSIEVQKYEPPIYEIKFQWEVFREKACASYLGLSEHNIVNEVYRYNYNTKQVWRFYKKAGSFTEKNLLYNYEDKFLLDEVFKVAYGIPFFNEVKNESIALGGISLNDNITRVLDKCGEPTEYDANSLTYDFTERDNYKSLLWSFEKDGRITRISNIEVPGIAPTPYGIDIGSRSSDVIRYYGAICGCYKEPSDACYHYSSPNGANIDFRVEDGIVTEILIYKR